MATAKNKTTGKEERYEVLPLSKIKADYAWNARQGLIDKDGKPVLSSGDETKNNLQDLMNSIELEGQDDPVVVRPIGKGENFSLVAGFRRFLAIKMIAEKQGKKDATIKAFVRHMSDLEARAANIRENTARDDLRGPDLAWSVSALEKAYVDKGMKASSVVIANSIGKNQSYVAKLMRIMTNCDPKVTTLWREAPFQVSISDMEKIAAYEKDRQLEALQEILKNKSGTGGQGAGGGRGQWLEAAIKKAESVGTLIGRLTKAELIDSDGLDFGVADHVKACVSLKAEATDAQVRKVGKALDKGFTEAMNASDESEEEPAPKSRRGNGRQSASAN
jgi:ParB/RepB/Spo0J family partition protein